GELPFRGSRLMILTQVVNEDPKAPRRLNDRIPRDLETICLKAMAKEPNRRYSSAGQLADDLRRHLSGFPIRARAVSNGERAWRWARRRPAIATLSASIVLVIVMGFGLVTWLWQRAEEAREEATTKAAAETRALAGAVEEKNRADLAQQEAEKERR